jgi:CheY-like chemotaxis protein
VEASQKPIREDVSRYLDLLDLTTDGHARQLIVDMATEESTVPAKLDIRQPLTPLSVVLVVEDDLLVREAAEVLIQDLGHRTLSASDMDEARSILRSPHRIDGLFTDIYLKAAILGGCMLAREAIALRPKLHVLYTTGAFVTDKMSALLVEGAQLLRKPYTERQLQEAIGHLLAP